MKYLGGNCRLKTRLIETQPSRDTRGGVAWWPHQSLQTPLFIVDGHDGSGEHSRDIGGYAELRFKQADGGRTEAGGGASASRLDSFLDLMRQLTRSTEAGLALSQLMLAQDVDISIRQIGRSGLLFIRVLPMH